MGGSATGQTGGFIMHQSVHQAQADVWGGWDAVNAFVEFDIPIL